MKKILKPGKIKLDDLVNIFDDDAKIEIDISNSTISGQVDATTSSSSSATTSTSSAVTSASTSSSYISSSSSSSGY